MTTILLSLENDTKKKRDLSCGFDFAKKDTSDISEKKWGSMCIPAISYREQCWEEYNYAKEARQKG